MGLLKISLLPILVIFVSLTTYVSCDDSSGKPKYKIESYQELVERATKQIKEEISKISTDLKSQKPDVYLTFESTIKTQFMNCYDNNLIPMTEQHFPNINHTIISWEDFVTSEAETFRTFIKKIVKCTKAKKIFESDATFRKTNKCIDPTLLANEKCVNNIATGTKELEKFLKDYPNQINSCLNEETSDCLGDLSNILKNQCDSLTKNIQNELKIMTDEIADFTVAFKPCLNETVQEIRDEIMKEKNFDILEC